jgi:FtsH-binding integral membrane protein
MAYPCCLPKDPSDVFGECAKSDLNRLKPLNLYGDVAIFCLITVIDLFIIFYYRKKAKFDPYALAFMFLLWMAFLASMIGSAISLVYMDNIGHALLVANYAAYVITRSCFWGLLYIYLFKLHDIYTVQRYGDKGRNYKYRE